MIIYTYDSAEKDPKADRRSGINYAMAYAVQTALEQIITYNKREGSSGKGGCNRKEDYHRKESCDTDRTTILLLGRFSFDGDRLVRTGLFEYINRGSKVKSVKYPHLDITFMTAHASKGLGYDNVIVINGRNETYGFPAKIEDDPVLSLVIKEDKSMQYAEERRLFYVAMTRTKNRVYFIAPEKNPSEFLLEIKKEYKNVFLRGKWYEEEQNAMGKHTCPICGFPLQLKYKPAYGLRLYICTNEPEVCSFMTSNLRGRKLSILKCPDCYDGYLIVKSSRKSGKCFLGCTNYKENRQGCNKTVSMREYYKAMGYDQEDIDEAASPNNQFQKQKDASQNRNPLCLREPLQTVKPQDMNRPGMDNPNASQPNIDPANMNQPSIEHQNGNFSITEERILRHKNWEKELMEETLAKPVDDSKYPTYNGHSLLKITGTILQCLVSISADKYYNGTILIRTLYGSSDQRILQDKLNLVPEYGRLSDLDRASIRKMVNWLIEKHYILETKAHRPVLHITNEGLHYKEHMTPRNMKSLLDLLNGTSEGENKLNTAGASKKWSKEEYDRLTKEFSSD